MMDAIFWDYFFQKFVICQLIFLNNIETTKTTVFCLSQPTPLLVEIEWLPNCYDGCCITGDAPLQYLFILPELVRDSLP